MNLDQGSSTTKMIQQEKTGGFASDQMLDDAVVRIVETMEPNEGLLINNLILKICVNRQIKQMQL